MDLNEDDVIQIIRYLDESNFNELRLQLGDLRLVVIRQAHGEPVEPSAPSPDVNPFATPGQSPAPSVSPPPPRPAGEPLIAPPTPSERFEERQTPTPAEEPIDPGQRITITSPMLGTFYRAPAPGEPPFVEVGSVVDEDTTVCIIEVMKLFSTIKAEKRGRISRVSVEDGQLVEYGQVLFLLEPGPLSSSPPQGGGSASSP